MKKRQEGYVLVYVMVALVLLSLLGAVSCSIAVSNLKAQQASIDRMRDEYAAEGVIEQFCAEIRGEYKGTSTQYTSADLAQAGFFDAFKNSFGADPPLKGGWDDVTIAWTPQEGATSIYTATLELGLESVENTSKVEATIEVEMVLKYTTNSEQATGADGNLATDSDGNPIFNFKDGTYTVTVGEPTYTAFNHTTVEGNTSDESLSAEFRVAAAGEYTHEEEYISELNTAKSRSYTALKNTVNESSSINIEWPEYISWSTPVEVGSDAENGLTTYQSTATLTLTLTDTESGAETVVEVEATLKTVEHSFEKQEGTVDNWGTSTTEHEYACTITLGEPKTVTPESNKGDQDTEPSDDGTDETGSESSSATIYVSIESGKLSYRAEGSVTLSVGEEYTVNVTGEGEISKKNLQSAKKALSNNLESSEPSIAKCSTCIVTGVSAGNTTLVAESYGISIDVHVK